MRRSVTLCTECEQKNPIEKFCIRRSVTLYAECERYTGYLMNKAFVHLRTRGSIMANDVRREAIEDRLLRRRERDKIPLTAKLSRGKTFAVVHKTHHSLENFRDASGPCHYILYTANDSRGKLSRLAKKPRKFSPSKVLPYTVEEREKPVKKDAQGLLNSACITHFPHFSHLAY